jgi:hypothetical protein
MGMQYDVKQAHLDESGFMVLQPTRVKAISLTGGGVAGYVTFFDTTSVPVSSSVSYGRSGTTVTVTKTAHGLSTGDTIGIHFVGGSGGTATDGTYTITRTGADTFTLVDINTGTITGSPAAVYAVGRWLATYQATAEDYFFNGFLIPGEGIRAFNGVYGYFTGLNSTTIYYG